MAAVAIRLADLAVRYGCELHGDPDREVSCVGTLESAGPAAIAFLANPQYRKQLATTGAAAVILTAEAVADCPVPSLVATNPYAVYAAVAAELYPLPLLNEGVHPQASVSSSARIGAGSEVAAGAVVGRNVRIGDRVLVGPNCVVGDDCVIEADTRLFANVTLYSRVRVGSRCILHAGVVLGADGFGIAQTPVGWRKVPQVGGVVIGNDVEIGANSCVDRGAIEDTVLGNGVKLDNQVQIGHNCRVGDHTAMASQSGISGSTVVGARCVIGGKAAVAGHLVICDDVFLAGRASVTKSIATPGVYSSVFPAEEAGVWRKLVARFKRLDEMSVRLKQLEKQLKSAADRNN
jgi:UDP-3-O-[3-hydroxymyristoyl] glucosamine N-acyltransferase